MRSILHEYFRPSEVELEALWKDGLLTFDASVLLNIYGYSTSTREALTGVLTQYRERLFLTHQFALEYSRNRAGVIVRQITNCDKTLKAFREIENSQLIPKRESPHLSQQSERALKAIVDELETTRLNIERLIGSDPYADLILAAFEGRVGDAPDDESLKQLHAQAAARFAGKIPPGYIDEKKKGIPKAYGDFIGWHQLMAKSKDSATSIILVTDENKEDWWQIEGTRTVAPRPELLAEFRTFTGQKIWIYNSEGFLRSAQQYLKAEIDPGVIREVGQSIEVAQRERIVLSQKPVATELPIVSAIQGKPIVDQEKA